MRCMPHTWAETALCRQKGAASHEDHKNQHAQKEFSERLEIFCQKGDQIDFLRFRRIGFIRFSAHALCSLLSFCPAVGAVSISITVAVADPLTESRINISKYTADHFFLFLVQCIIASLISLVSAPSCRTERTAASAYSASSSASAVIPIGGVSRIM